MAAIASPVQRPDWSRVDLRNAPSIYNSMRGDRQRSDQASSDWPGEVNELGPEWRLDWRSAVDHTEVFKLIDPATPDTIFGLMALVRQRVPVACRSGERTATSQSRRRFSPHPNRPSAPIELAPPQIEIKRFHDADGDRDRDEREKRRSNRIEPKQVAAGKE